MGGVVFEVFVWFTSGTLGGMDRLQGAEQTLTRAACGGMDDDSRTLRRAGSRDRRLEESVPFGRPRSGPPYGSSAPRARRTLLQGGLNQPDRAAGYTILMDLFDAQNAETLARRAPLAERLRPKSLHEVVGQDHLTGFNGPLQAAVEKGRVGAIILWGPPGSGKTTLACVLSAEVGGEFVPLSAVTSGVKEVRGALDAARERLKYEGRPTILFVDEVHRFNKVQQDVLLPTLEEGLVDFIGATTENPSFEVTAPLLSRSRVLRLRPLSEEDLTTLLARGCSTLAVEISSEAQAFLLRLSCGDGRRLLNALEAAATSAAGRVEVADAEGAVGDRALRYGREEHYDVISAFIKSVRGGDPDAALHYLARMIEAGEDPIFIARRLVI